ncbi:DUF2905 domain-containing protein [Alphaproteobacteria bacterium]|nr:DUF2905 domain-containing protein [Alphaproteobacteria bacterium]
MRILFIVRGQFYLLIKDLGFVKLPGDTTAKRGNSSFYFPIITCLIATVVSSLLFIFLRNKLRIILLKEYYQINQHSSINEQLHRLHSLTEWPKTI